MSPQAVYKKEKCENLSPSLSLSLPVLGFYADIVTVTVLELNNSEG